MPKTRIDAANDVASAFLDAEVAAGASAALSCRLTAVLIEAHRRARLEPGVGGDVIKLIDTASHHAVAAREAYMAAHPRLAEIARDLNVPSAYGPDGCDYPADSRIFRGEKVQPIGA